MVETKNNKEELYNKVIKLKKPFLSEFQSRGKDRIERGMPLDYTEFCIDKLRAAQLTEEQLIIANVLIDIGIGIGRFQVLDELLKERTRDRKYIIELQESLAGS